MLGPADEPVDVLARRPRLPNAPRLVLRPAGEAPALHVHQQLRAVGAVNDEVQTLDRRVVERDAVGLVHSDVAEPPGTQVRLEGRLVVVTAVHGRGPRRVAGGRAPPARPRGRCAPPAWPAP